METKTLIEKLKMTNFATCDRKEIVELEQEILRELACATVIDPELMEAISAFQAFASQIK